MQSPYIYEYHGSIPDNCDIRTLKALCDLPPISPIQYRKLKDRVVIGFGGCEQIDLECYDDAEQVSEKLFVRVRKGGFSPKEIRKKKISNESIHLAFETTDYREADTVPFGLASADSLPQLVIFDMDEEKTDFDLQPYETQLYKLTLALDDLDDRVFKAVDENNDEELEELNPQVNKLLKEVFYLSFTCNHVLPRYLFKHLRYFDLEDLCRITTAIRHGVDPIKKN